LKADKTQFLIFQQFLNKKNQG